MGVRGTHAGNPIDCKFIFVLGSYFLQDPLLLNNTIDIDRVGERQG